MKVLQINCVYRKGSTGKITYDIHQGLQQYGIDSVVCYGRGERYKEPDVYKTCSELYSNINHLWADLTGVMYGGCFFSTKKLIQIIKKEKPDIVHLQCINGNFVNIYRLIEWLKINRIRTVLTLHAEFMYTGGCGYSMKCNQWINPNGCGYHMKCPRYRTEFHSYFFDRSATMWRKMQRVFEGFEENLLVTSVSPWLKDRAEKSPIFAGKKHKVVLNGLNTEIFHNYDEIIKNNIKEELGILDKPIVFHATPSFSSDKAHIKGGYYVVELAKMMPDVIFVVAGSHSDEIDIPHNIILLGHVSDQIRLAQLYSTADVTLLTSKKETFSMVTAESLCCGTPVVGFKAGAPELIALPKYSEFVEPGKLDELKKSTNKMLSENNCEGICDEASEMYSRKTMIKKFIEVYSELI